MIELILFIETLVYEAQKNAAALKVFQKRTEENQGPLPAILEISRKAIEQQTLSIISKIFDSEKTCGYTNCSIEMLRKLCSEQNVSTDILEQMDKLVEKYQSVISKETRNKRLAHMDYESMKEGITYYIGFESLEDLIEGLCDLISAVSREVLTGEITFPKITNLVSQLENGFSF